MALGNQVVLGGNRNRQAFLLSAASLAAVMLVADSMPAAAFSASTGGSTTYTSTDTPTAIPDLGTATSTINVTDEGLITDVDVEIEFTHTSFFDIEATVTSPDSTDAELFSNVQGPFSADGIYILDDQAATNIDSAPNDGTTVTPGSYTTESGSALSAFNGLSPNGNWTLTMDDEILFDSGTLTEWRLIITALGPGCGLASDGSGPTGGNDTISCDVNNDVQGAFDAGGGNDTININPGTYANDISGGADNDTLNVFNGADVNGNVLGGTGNDTFNIYTGGEAQNVLGDNGIDTFNLLGGNVVRNIRGNSGNDIFNLNSGTVGLVVYGGNGEDEFNLNGANLSGTDLNGENDNDTFNLNSGTAQNAIGEGGADTFNLQGATINNNLAGRSGNDIFNLRSGTVGNQVLGGNSDDTINVFSTFTLLSTNTFDGGDNTDTLNLFGQTIEVANLPTIINFENTNLLQGTTLQVFSGAAVFPTPSLRVDASSAIDMRDGAADDQLTVNGYYASNGGLLLDAELNTAGGTADNLVVNGNVGNSATQITVADVGDGSGSTDPLTLVTVTGSVEDDDFALANDVFSGPFQYALLRDGQNFNLVSSLLDQALVAPTIQSIIAGDTGELIGRLEDRRSAACGGGREPVADLENPYMSVSRWCMWARIGGNNIDADGTLADTVVSETVSYDSTLGFIQGGLAVNLINDGASKLIASVFGHYADSNASIADDTGSTVGTIANTSGGVAASLTWLVSNGFYADLVGYASWHDIDTVTTDGASGSTNGDTLAGSLEMGYRFYVSDSVRIVPQAQVVYQNTSIDDYTDSRGVAMAFNDADHVEGRFGVALEQVSHMYIADGIFKTNASVDVVHDFTDDGGAVLNATPLGFEARGTELVLGGGFSVLPYSTGFKFGGQADYRIALDDEGREGFSLEATAGIDF